MVTPDTHPCLVAAHVIDAIGIALPARILGKVVDHGFLGFPLRLPLPARVLEIPHQSFFLVSTETTGWAR